MLDYRTLHCLSEVIRFGSFERGAQALNLTQSAVSQKIKRLENNVSGPVLIRTKPLRATPLGEQLLAHFHKISVLEEQLYSRTGLKEDYAPISVAVNNDVLATWFSDVMSRFSQTHPNPVHIYNADQSQTRSVLQQGKVMGCISQTGTPVAGGQSVRLGTMDYQLYASPEFIHRYLQEGVSVEGVLQAPGLLYDEFDVALLSDYQSECLGITPYVNHCHWYPSSHGFVRMTTAGVACSLLPTLQVRHEVATGQLVALFPDKLLKVPLFWHWFELESDALAAFTRAVKVISRMQLSR